MMFNEPAKSLEDMTIAELEEVQRSLLYPWEFEAWEKQQLMFLPGDQREWLMDETDKLIFSLQCHE